MTRTDRRGTSTSSRALPPPRPPWPPYVAVGTCNVTETGGRTSAVVDASATCPWPWGNSGTGPEEGTAGSGEDDVDRVGAGCAALATAAGEELSDGLSTTREGWTCFGEEK